MHSPGHAASIAVTHLTWFVEYVLPNKKKQTDLQENLLSRTPARENLPSDVRGSNITFVRSFRLRLGTSFWIFSSALALDHICIILSRNPVKYGLFRRCVINKWDPYRSDGGILWRPWTRRMWKPNPMTACFKEPCSGPTLIRLWLAWKGKWSEDRELRFRPASCNFHGLNSPWNWLKTGPGHGPISVQTSWESSENLPIIFTGIILLEANRYSLTGLLPNKYVQDTQCRFRCFNIANWEPLFRK